LLKRILVASIVAILATLAANAGLGQAGKSCSSPQLLGVRWIFSFTSDGSPGNPSFEVVFNPGSLAGTVLLNDNVGGITLEEDEFRGNEGVQTDTFLSTEVGWGTQGPFELVVNTSCGSSSATIKPNSPFGGQWGRQLFACADYVIIDNRGSERPEGEISPPGQRFAREFRKLHRQATIDVLSDPYPAVGGLKNMLEAEARLPNSPYQKSVRAGKDWLEQEIQQLSEECPVTEVFVVGYSQGAEVAGDVTRDPAQWDQLKGVALFGDPLFNPRDKADRGDFSSRQHGSLGMRDPFASWGDFLVRSYCHRYDPVCQGAKWWPIYRFSKHINYGQFGEAELAASYFSRATG